MTSEVVAGLVTIASVLISNYFTNSKTIYRIDQLEKKVEKHNNLVEKYYKHDEEIKLVSHRIEELEEKNKVV